MNGGTTTTWRLVSLSPLPVWALAVLTVLVLAGVVLAVLGLRREPSAFRRRVLLVLRLLAGAMALFFLLEPGLRQLAQVRVKNRVAVLVDRSASMGFPVRPDGPSRAAAAAEALDRFAPGLEALRDRYQVEVLGFSPELGPVSAEALRDAGDREQDRSPRGAAGAEGHRHRGEPEAGRGHSPLRRRGQQRAPGWASDAAVRRAVRARLPGLHHPGGRAGAGGPRRRGGEGRRLRLRPQRGDGGPRAARPGAEGTRRPGGAAARRAHHRNPHGASRSGGPAHAGVVHLHPPTRPGASSTRWARRCTPARR
jgi:hypothetical protein